MKRDYVTMAVAVVALVLAVAGFTMKPDTAGQQTKNPVDMVDTMKKIREKGEIVACYVPYAEAVIKDQKTGKLSGHSVDTIEHIAKQVNAKVSYHETTWGNAATEVATGKCDVMLYFFDQIPRAFTVAFTRPIIFEGNGAVVKKDDTRFNNIKDITELDKPEYTIVVANGESGHNFVKENFKKAKIEVIDVETGDITKHLVAVSTGRADIGIISADGADSYVKVHPETQNIFAANPFSLNPTAYAVKQNDLKFLNFLNNALNTMEVQGTIKGFENKYNTHTIRQKVEYTTN